MGIRHHAAFVIAVIALPRLGGDDRLRIETIRYRYDPQHGRIGPHITLVFPQRCVDPDAVIRHVGTVAGRHKALPVRIRTAVAVHGNGGQAAHVYLVPDEGRADLVRLHEDLYEGMPTGPDPAIPYIPHVTVAETRHIAAARTIADGLNARSFEIAFRIDAISVVRCDRADLRDLAQIGLGSAPASP